MLDFTVNSTYLFFAAVTLLAHLFLVMLSGALLGGGYDLVPIEFGSLPLYIPDDVDYLRSIAWYTKDDTDAVIERTSPDTADGTEKERSLYGDVIEMYYHIKKDGNVFTKENLQAMKEKEDEYFRNPVYQEKFCLLNHFDPANPVCSKMTSVLRYFDGTYQRFDSRFLDVNFDNIAEVLYLANTHEETTRSFQYHLAEDAIIEPDRAESIITRSRLVVGWPLRGYANTSVEETEQETKIKDFQVDEYKTDLENQYSDGVGEMGFFFGSGFLLTATIEKQVIVDMSLAFGSLVFIVIFVSIQTGSLWITLLAVLSILTSFLGANLIYRVVLDYRYLGIFHVLTIFIILGIGADNIFVVFDTWKESSHHKYKSLAHRMSDVYRKAAMAMLFTSTTTAVAFIVSATSPFIVISSFGVFAGILVAVNYLSIIIYFPTVVTTYHFYWDKYKCCCCCNRSKRVSSVEDVHEEAEPTAPPKPNAIVRFLSTTYFNVVTHKIYRWIILAIYAVLIIVSIAFATQLRINEEQVTHFLST